jgi:hypothetical protein
MRSRPANIRLINRRSNPPRLLLALSSENGNNNPTHSQGLTGSLHIRDGSHPGERAGWFWQSRPRLYRQYGVTSEQTAAQAITYTADWISKP